MTKQLMISLGLAAACGAVAAAEDGEMLYGMICSACHAPDGKGMNDGQFPPLAGSEWVQGEPDLMLQVVLHGLQGEVVVPLVTGEQKTYNLVMPPQGGALTDPQIAAITSHVRSAWGNKGAPVTVAMVEEARKKSGDRKTMWDAEELWEKFGPGEVAGNAVIKHLVASAYQGAWGSMPDFSTLEPKSVEEEQGGLISLEQSGMKTAFGMVWEGEITARTDGVHTFAIDSDDGSAVFVDGTLVAAVKGLGGMGRKQEGRIKLTAGAHRIRIEYFEKSGQKGISLAMKGPGNSGWTKLSKEPMRGRKGGKSIPIVPPKGEAVMYRNFIEGTTPRAIGVGYDGGVNLAFSADTMAVELLWIGNFMDGGRHWSGRGQGAQKPAGVRVVKVSSGPAFAVLESPEAEWPTDYQEGLEAKFRGYKLNAKQEPAFYYTMGNLEVEDRSAPVVQTTQTIVSGLVRTLTINAAGDAPEVVYWRVASGLEVAAGGTHVFTLNGTLALEVDKQGGGDPVVRGKDVLVPIHLKNGAAEVTVRYAWK